MKKERFLGYLDALMDMAEACQFNEDQIPELIGDIRKKAEELDEPIETLPTYPAEPWWQKPWITYRTTTTGEPTFTWSPQTWSIDFDVDITDSICYNSKLPNPNEWSVKKDSKLPSNWKIIK